MMKLNILKLYLKTNKPPHLIPAAGFYTQRLLVQGIDPTATSRRVSKRCGGKAKIALTVFLVLLGSVFTLSPVILPIAAQADLPNYNLNIITNVRNLTSGQGNFSDNVNASNNDRLMFQIQIQNTGGAVLNNVIVRDILPSYISYIYGTARLDNEITADSLISGGINIGSIYTNSSRLITFEALVNYTGASQNLTLTNRAYVHADQVSEKNDTATIYVTQATTVNNLNINNSVRNLTAGQNSFSSGVNANAGDHVLFLIELTTPANAITITNLRVWDVLPAGLTYINGSTRVDGGYANDNIVSGGINLGAMYAGQGHRINFEASVNSAFYTNQILTNYAYVSGDGVYQRSSSAQITVSQTAINSSLNSVNSNQAQDQTTTSKTGPVAAITGSDSRTATFAFSIIGALWFIFLFYLLVEYATFWRDWKFKLAVLKARMIK